MNIQQKTGKELFAQLGRDDLVQKIKHDLTIPFTKCKSGLFFFTENDLERLKSAHVFAVLVNSDMTEGRGPMIVHKIFSSLDNAVEYILSKDGVFGSKQYMKTNAGVNIGNQPYLYTSFNGFEIKIVAIEDGVLPNKEPQVKPTPLVQSEPDKALLESMAMRYDHGFGLMTPEQQNNVLSMMRQLWEEVAGFGFYKQEQKTVGETEFDSFDDLVLLAKEEARKAMVKFPQPNYVITKLAEEAGEVVGGCVKYIEGRQDVHHVRMEMKQLIGVLYRLWHEGDGVHGCPPIKNE